MSGFGFQGTVICHHIILQKIQITIETSCREHNSKGEITNKLNLIPNLRGQQRTGKI
jgi:hypothetical protein